MTTTSSLLRSSVRVRRAMMCWLLAACDITTVPQEADPPEPCTRKAPDASCDGILDASNQEASDAVPFPSMMPREASLDAAHEGGSPAGGSTGRAPEARDEADAAHEGGGSDPERDATVLDEPADAGPQQPPCSPSKLAHAFRSQTLLDYERAPAGQIMTADIQRVSLAGDAEPELLVAQPLRGQLSWLRGCGDGECEVTELTGLGQPVRSALVDAEGDGDTDILVADIGSVPAVTERVGRVMLLVNQGDLTFTLRQLWDDVGRVSCAEPGDFDGDGDADVVVCEFGAADGSVTWLERKADNTYVTHELKRGAGAIEAVPQDIDGDHDVDIIVSLSQDYQQIALFRNDGAGDFDEEVLWQAPDDFGLVGLEAVDLNQDGKLDFVVSGGDYFDETYSFDHQGVWWLEGDGEGGVTPHPVQEGLLGPHVTRAADLDGDCDLDLAVATMRVEALLPADRVEEAGLWWLENDGSEAFTPHAIGSAPTHSAALEVADFGTGPSLFVGSLWFGTARASDLPLGALWAR